MVGHEETTIADIELAIAEDGVWSTMCGNFTPVLITKDSSKKSDKPWLSAPETVHWAVTYSCHENCPDCYARRFSFIKKELDTRQALKLIDKIAYWNVFQLAIGGGEPFMMKDLPQLVHHAASRGLSVHITTGKLDMDNRILKSLSPSIKQLQFGIRPDDLIESPSGKSIQQIQNLFATLQKLGITPGANLFLTKFCIEQLENLIKILTDIGFNRIILLRYKPPASLERWKTQNPDLDQMKGLHERINRIVKENPSLNMRVDCALSFVQRHLSMKLAIRLGIKGCVAADRILALASDGSVYPCSQLVHPDYCAGNLLESDLEQLWNQSSILRKYRSFRTKKAFTHSWCGVCRANGFLKVYLNRHFQNEEEFETETDRSLLNLLAQNREYLKSGDYRLLYGVWQKYGFEPEGGKESEEKAPPKVSKMDKLPRPVEHLLSLLERA